MKTLHIIVANKTATYSHRGGDIVCGNSDYQIEFNFDKEWDAYETKTARFIWNDKYKDVTFPGNVCPVPIVANTDRLEVGVYAEDLSTTTSAVITCRRSIRCNTDLESDGTVAVTEVIPSGYVKPSGTLNITTNGEHLVTLYEKVAVNVESGVKLQASKTVEIDTNGEIEIKADSGYDGIVKVVAKVNVPTGNTLLGDWVIDQDKLDDAMNSVPEQLLDFKFGADNPTAGFTSYTGIKSRTEINATGTANVYILQFRNTSGNYVDVYSMEDGASGDWVGSFWKGDFRFETPQIVSETFYVWFNAFATQVSESGVAGIDTCTMEYVSGGDPLGIVYSNGAEATSWANTPVGESITVACNTPIVFYNPMGDDNPSVTLTTENGATIQPYFTRGTTKTIYAIPSEYKNTHITVSW